MLKKLLKLSHRRKHTYKWCKTNSRKKSIVKGNKQTKEEKTEKARIRKQNQRERQKQIYGDEEYKKMKAKEIVEYRAKKKE